MCPNAPRRFSGLILFALAMVALPSAAALNPLDNDGGSGHDAGDLPSEAAPIQPGKILGSLTPPLDPRDYYRFDAAAGTVVRLAFTSPIGAVYLRSSDGATFGVAPPGRPVQLVLPKAGSWFLLVAVHQNPVNYMAGPTNYEFDFATEQRAHVALVSPAAGWQVVEAQWNVAQKFAYSAWLNPDLDALNFQPTGAIFALNHRFIEGNEVHEPVFADQLYRTTASGEQLVAGSIGPYAVPPTPALVDDANDELNQPLFGGADACTDCSGTLRVRMMATGAHAWLVAIASTDPFEVRNASGTDLALWSERDNQGNTQVVAPGAAVDMERQRTLEVSADFLGSFMPYRAKGSVTRPDGRVTALDCTFIEANICQTSDFFGPFGTWTLRIEPRAAVGPGSDLYYLIGASFPRLGLWDSPQSAANESAPNATSPPMPLSTSPATPPSPAGSSAPRYVRVEASPGPDAWVAAIVMLAGLAVVRRRV